MDTVLTGGDFERKFGTSMSRFQSVMQHFKLEETPDHKLHIPRNKMFFKFFQYYRTIDIHDHYRQGNLAFERDWITRNWFHSFFRTMLGVITTNTYLPYRFEKPRQSVASSAEETMRTSQN